MAERAAWRGDIEGLRAVAIVPVVLFHLDRAYAPGGFLGVDLFLVISGYLITQMLFTGTYLESAGGVRRFLRRRFLRIMPALAVTVGAFALAFAWVALPGYHRPFFITGLASLFGVSNVVLADASTDYFAPAAGLNPFLHTWSISIEDQFYVGFVGGLFLLTRVVNRRQTALIVAGLTLVALVHAAFSSLTADSRAFFAFDRRAWEFLLGASAYLAEKALRPGPRRWADHVRWVAMAGVVYLMLRVDESSARFIHYLLLCVACAALLVRTTPLGPSRLANVLSQPILRRIGRRSFAIYLVHFPLLKLISLVADVGWGHPWSGLAYLGATLLLAEALHRGVERPYVESYRSPVTARGRWRPPAGSLWGGAVASVLVAVVALPHVSRARTLAPRLATVESRDLPHPGAREVVVIGDSHAQQFSPALSLLAATDSLSVINRTMFGCMASEDLAYVERGVPNAGCQASVRATVDDIAAHPRARRVVLIAMRSLGYLSPQLLSRFDRPMDGVMQAGTFHSNAAGRSMDAYVASLGRTVDRLASVDVPVVFLAPLPEMRLPTYSCFFNSGRADCMVDRADELAYRAALLARLHALQARHPTFGIWDPFDAVCPDPACTNIRGDTVVFSDDDHLSAEMAAALAPSLRAALERAVR